MTLPPNLLEHKTLMIALLAIAQQIATHLGVDPSVGVAATCRATGANRSSVYEQGRRIEGCLDALAAARPGRPPSDPSEPDGHLRLLTIEVLDYQIEHPGALVSHGRRSEYAPDFKRFILTRLDDFPGPLSTFADAVRIPLDTLRDWTEQEQRFDQTASSPPQSPCLSRDASEIVREVVALRKRWIGSTRAFIPYAAQRLGLLSAQVARLLKIVGLVAPHQRKPFRHRESTEKLSPGTLLVTDGKQLDIELAGSGQRTSRNWQAMVDQTTGCDTAVVVNLHECAQGVTEAFLASVGFLGGSVPEGLLHDNKPIHQEQQLTSLLDETGTAMIPATPARGENKAVIEGAFGLWEQRVGTIRLDDTTKDTLITSAVHEIVRAYTAATNAVPRAEFHGQSRERQLQKACPSPEQRQRDIAFLKTLRARHLDQSNRRPREKDGARKLLDLVFDKLELTENDPDGALRNYLATYEPAAIRRAAAIVTAKRDRGELELDFAHRYLTKVIQNVQAELNVERAARELLELAQAQRQLWTENEQREIEQILRDNDEPEHVARACARKAALAKMPLQAAFWNNELLKRLLRSKQLAERVARFLVRFYEAPTQIRIALIDDIYAQAHGLA